MTETQPKRPITFPEKSLKTPLPIPVETLRRIASFNLLETNPDGTLKHPQREGRVNGVRKELLDQIRKLAPGESTTVRTESKEMVLNIRLAVGVNVDIEYSDGVAKIRRT